MLGDAIALVMDKLKDGVLVSLENTAKLGRRTGVSNCLRGMNFIYLQVLPHLMHFVIRLTRHVEVPVLLEITQSFMYHQFVAFFVIGYSFYRKDRGM